MLSYHVLPSSVSLSYDGKVVSIPSGDRRHNRIMEAIRENRLQDIPDIVEDLERYFAQYPEVTYNEGRVLIDGHEIDEDLNHYIIGLAEQGIPFDRMIIFWRRLHRSDRFGVRSRLFAFLQRQEHPITEDGRFLAYRRVKEGKDEDGNRVLLDCHTGKINNSVGQIVEMDRAEVCDDPAISCSSGLHAASFSYAKNFYANGILIEVAIAPEDVICVPHDYSAEKMRICRYEVLNEIEGPRQGPAADIASQEHYFDDYSANFDDDHDDSEGLL